MQLCRLSCRSAWRIRIRWKQPADFLSGRNDGEWMLRYLSVLNDYLTATSVGLWMKLANGERLAHVSSLVGRVGGEKSSFNDESVKQCCRNSDRPSEGTSEPLRLKRLL